MVSYTAAISACAEAGRAAEAAALLEELRSSGLPLSILPFSKAIAAAAKAGEWRVACATLVQVSSLQLRHNALTTSRHWGARGLLPIDVRHHDQSFNQALTTNLVLRACDVAGEPAAALSALLPLLRESAAAGLASLADEEALFLIADEALMIT